MLSIEMAAPEATSNYHDVSGSGDVFSRLSAVASRASFAKRMQTVVEEPCARTAVAYSASEPEIIDTGLLSALRESENSQPAQAEPAMQSEALPSFTVAKPGIKAAKKATGRGKGVIGAVLGADGSVTHEQSHML